MEQHSDDEFADQKVVITVDDSGNQQKTATRREFVIGKDPNSKGASADSGAKKQVKKHHPAAARLLKIYITIHRMTVLRNDRLFIQVISFT